MTFRKYLKRDKGRTFEIEKFGIKVLIFTNEEVINSTERVIQKIRANFGQ